MTDKTPADDQELTGGDQDAAVTTAAGDPVLVALAKLQERVQRLEAVLLGAGEGGGERVIRL